MSSQPTSSMSWVDYINVQKEFIECPLFRHGYEFDKIKDLKKFLEIINYPYDINFIKKIYHSSNPIRIMFTENYNFFKNVGKINDAISIENPTRIINLIKETDYALKYSWYMYHLYYESMKNNYINEEESIKHKIRTIYDWWCKDKIDMLRHYKNARLSNYYEIETQIISLIERTYSSNVTDILINNFINSRLIDKHNYTSDIELKKILFRFIFIEIIQQKIQYSIRFNTPNITIPKSFYDYLEDTFEFNLDLCYKKFLDTRYKYFDRLIKIKDKLLEQIKYD